MTARAPIPAAIRFEYQAPEGATAYCPGHPGHRGPHYLQVVDIEAVWEPVVEAGRLTGVLCSLRLTGEDPTCEITLGRPTEPWMHDILSASYAVVCSLDQVRIRPYQPLGDVMA